MSVAEKLRPATATRRWVGLGAAALVWIVLYQANGPFWDWLVYSVADLDPVSRLGSGVHFFFEDTAKIGLLLVGIIFAVTVLRSFMRSSAPGHCWVASVRASATSWLRAWA